MWKRTQDVVVVKDSSSNDIDVATQIAAILGTMLAVLVGLVLIQVRAKPPKSSKTTSTALFLADPKRRPSKRAYEEFVAMYTPVWIIVFGIVVVFELYENFTAWSYLFLCGGLALPLLLQPVLYPQGLLHGDSPDAKRPLLERYSTKANVWIAIYSFIGNYWYTHYFYSVLQARYTMPAHRLNNVPIALFLATHFYFSTYHLFSNVLLRWVVTTFQGTVQRHVLYIGVVVVFAYFTAFMETLTISSYPYYSFQDRDMAYTIGSAFYGIYFLVSFPAFFVFDDEIDSKRGKPVTMWNTIVSSCGYGMMILLLLDFVRVYLQVPLVVGADPKSCRF